MQSEVSIKVKLLFTIEKRLLHIKEIPARVKSQEFGSDIERKLYTIYQQQLLNKCSLVNVLQNLPPNEGSWRFDIFEILE